MLHNIALFIIFNLIIGLINTILLLLIEPLLTSDFIKHPEHFSNNSQIKLEDEEDVSKMERFKQELWAYTTNCVPIINLYRLLRFSVTLVKLLVF